MSIGLKKWIWGLLCCCVYEVTLFPLVAGAEGSQQLKGVPRRAPCDELASGVVLAALE